MSAIWDMPGLTTSDNILRGKIAAGWRSSVGGRVQRDHEKFDVLMACSPRERDVDESDERDRIGQPC